MQPDFSTYYRDDIKIKIENILYNKGRLMTWDRILKELVIIYPKEKEKSLYVNIVNATGDNCLADGIFFELMLPGKKCHIGLRSWLRKTKPFPMISEIRFQKAVID